MPADRFAYYCIRIHSPAASDPPSSPGSRLTNADQFTTGVQVLGQRLFLHALNTFALTVVNILVEGVAYCCKYPDIERCQERGTDEQADRQQRVRGSAGIKGEADGHRREAAPVRSDLRALAQWSAGALASAQTPVNE